MKPFLVVILLASAAVNRPESISAKEAAIFLGTLNESQRARAQFELASETLFDWHFVPRTRPGLPWGDMSQDQQKAAHALLKSSLSKAGYEKVENIRSLEPILRQLENGNPGRDEKLYTFSFFGEPSDNTPWAWRYEGHHISLTFVYREGRLVSSTPQFLGSNPEIALEGPKKKLQPLANERNLAYVLLDSLTDEQMSKAKIGSQSPGDIVTGNARRASIKEKKGIPYQELSTHQKKLLLNVLRSHAEVQSEREQNRRMKQIEDEELSDLVFAWMGSTDRKGRHYYRIQGKNLIVEYDNSQGNGSHVHTVWRNAKEDFGGDPLLHHYKHGHKH